MSQYSELWGAIRESLCAKHQLTANDFNENKPNSYAVRKKAYYLFLLEVILYDYRQNEVHVWFQQSIKNTYYSFIYSKTGLLPDQIKKLSDNEILFIIHKHIASYRLPADAHAYLNNISAPSAFDYAEVNLSGGWNLGDGAVYLRLN